MKIIKKNGSVEDFTSSKLISAIEKSASRVEVTPTIEEYSKIVEGVYNILQSKETDSISVKDVHTAVEVVLEEYNPKVAKSYKDYRNWKVDFAYMLDEVLQKDKSVRFIGDKENSNTDSALVATKRSLIYNEVSKQFYKKFNLTPSERTAIKDGYIYIHDLSARRDTFNCCLFDMGNVLKGGFEMGNINYTEPKSLRAAFVVIGDVTLCTAAQQYGGFTIPEIDKILEPYAEKSFDAYYHKYVDILRGTYDDMYNDDLPDSDYTHICTKAQELAFNDVRDDFEQGWQGLEMKLNTVGSSRGDYPFVTITLGLATSRFGKMAIDTCMKVHKGGQGKPGFKKPVLFPKIVFLYDEELHGEGGPSRDMYVSARNCSAKTMYPDWLSLTGDGYVASMYKKYRKVVSPMGCRAFLSPWYERGGMNPADEEDKPVFVGRFNIGAISLHLPMILAKSREEGRDFYEVLDEYMEMIRRIHIRTYDYLSNLRASVNPVAFCEGGLYGGNLNPQDRIKPLLKSATASFGITALNELQMLYNGKSIFEDGQFALEVMEWINSKLNEYKRTDGYLYAVYGTPAESLCGTQVKQFRAKYGVIPGVSDKGYVSNSFHCHVSEDITPVEKQNSERRFWNLFNGGKIQYCKYPINYNTEAIDTILKRAMDFGFYEGINMGLATCDDCGYEQLEMDVCPKCGSKNLTKIDRMNGYLSYSRVHGDTRLNEAKMEEIADRKSM